jgi:hypothetical protein
MMLLGLCLRNQDKENIKSYSGNSNEDVKEESKEPEYNEDKDQIEGEK